MEFGEDRREKAYGVVVPAASPSRCARCSGSDTARSHLGGDPRCAHAHSPAQAIVGWVAVADDYGAGGVRPHASVRLPLQLEDCDVRDYGSDPRAACWTRMLDDPSYRERPAPLDRYPRLEQP